MDIHKEFFRRWLVENGANRYSFEELWNIREACIAALAQ